MPLESGTTFSELDLNYPQGDDPTSEGDDHLRLIKSVLKKQFPGELGQGLDEAILATEDDLNNTTNSSGNFQAQIDSLTSQLNAVPGQVVDLIYPVGSLYTSTLNTNPVAILGVGTWLRYGEGRVMVGVDGTDPDFNTGGNLGGSKNATLPQHSHVGTTSGTDGDHLHSPGKGENFLNEDTVDADFFLEGGFPLNGARSATTAPGGEHAHAITIGDAGSDPTGANMPPYITVYTWIRDA